ncbi:hypothetical protein GJAV_G00169840 [Gymnothorax javanicus]|nr:hypothetical protein GJAV_G00169840 [Gymnothorax javanicus]
MNTYKQTHIFCKAKARRQCFFLIMCFHLVLGEVPGPCRHSVTKEHLINIKQLIDNQLENDCLITYIFMEQHGLVCSCYVKAAFPQILELLSTHFQYDHGSDNYRYILALKMLVLNIYSQKCIPEINEETEVNPVRFAKSYSSSAREALGKIREVIQLYMELMTENNKPVDWNCEEEYAEDYPETTTALTHTEGLGPRSSADFMGTDFSSQRADRDSGSSVKNEAQQASHISYKIAFIVTSVCGGLLLIITLHLLRKKRRLGTLHHTIQITENQTLTSFHKNIELQHQEITESSCLDSSSTEPTDKKKRIDMLQ